MIQITVRPNQFIKAQERARKERILVQSAR